MSSEIRTRDTPENPAPGIYGFALTLEYPDDGDRCATDFGAGALAGAARTPQRRARPTGLAGPGGDTDDGGRDG